MHAFLLLWACETTTPSGHLFEPVAPPAAVVPDPEWAIPTPDPVIPSEKLQETEAAAPAPQKDLFGNTVAATAPTTTPVAPVETPAPPPVGLPSDPWPVRLLSTLPQAQPPRAMIGLPSGEEKVVSPGSILADQGIVVMSVSADRIQVAKIVATGDHASIQSIELTAQYPGH